MSRSPSKAPTRAGSTHADRLARTPLGRELGKAALEALLRGDGVRTLVAGEQLAAQGSRADAAYLVVDGRVRVEVATERGRHVVATAGPGALLGEIGVLAGDRRAASLTAASGATVCRIPRGRLRRVLAEHPELARRVSREAAERMRRVQLVGQLERAFGPLPSEVLRGIEGLVEWLVLPSGAALFAQGDAANAAYLVVSGRLGVVREDSSGGEVGVTELGAGDLAGEAALVSGGARTATVHALRDSHLVRLSREAFDALLERHPTAGLAIARTVLERAQAPVQGTARPRSVVVVPAGDPHVADALAADLLACLGPGARELSSAAVDAALGVPGIAQAGEDEPGAIRLAQWLDEVQESSDFVVLRPDEGWTPWSLRALHCADQVLIVADATADPAPGPLEASMHRLLAGQRHQRVRLALVHPPSTDLPSGTRAWIDQRSLASHHHVRRGDPVTTARLARTLDGTATSLVLGGGGARGFAHLGVFSVLEEAGAVVDAVAGTSIGAVMALGVALDWPAAKARRYAAETFTDLLDYTFPTVSLLRGARITRKLRAVVGDLDIADLWVPFFCASANLTIADVHFHDRGDLVQAVRASIAIPGVLPPVPMDGDLHVDGGILDNLPVSEMRRRNPTGRILAIDVAPAEGPVAGRDYGLSVGGLRAWRDRRGGRSGPPSVVTTMVRSSLVAAVRDRDRVVRDEVADLYLDLAVQGGGMLDFTAGEPIADAAADAARPVLTAWLDGHSDHVGSYVRLDPTPPPAEAAPVAVDSRRGRGFVGVLLLTLRDLQRRAVRFAAVIAGTAVVFTLLFLMTGLVEQFHTEPKDTVAGFGADGWLLRDGVSGAFSSGTTMPADVAALVEGADAASAAVVSRHTVDDGSGPVDIVLIGVTPGGVGEPELVAGEMAAGPEELVVDDSAGLDVGDRTTLGEHEVTITGLTDRATLFAGMPLAFVDLRTAQDVIYRGQPLATTVLVDGTPTSVPDGFSIVAPEDIATDSMRPLERSISSITLVQVLLWFVAAMIVGTMIYLAALERRRDVAVLTAVGASRRQMAGSIALQSALTGLVAALAAAVLQRFVVPVFPLEVVVPDRALLQVPLLAVLVSLLAGGIGLRTVLKTDPALAFAGPGA